MKKNMTSASTGVCALLLLGSAACSSDDATCLDPSGQSADCEEGSPPPPQWAPALPGSPPLGERLEQIEGDLSLGSRGAEVRAVHEYLTQYGYLPNDELLTRHPRWRPIVSDAPAHPEVYDGTTAAAVSALQSFAGLEATGSVDEPTRALLRTPRCGYPDSTAHSDPSEKFATSGDTWPSFLTTLSWRLKTTNFPLPNGVTHAQARGQIAAAFASWDSVINTLSFVETTGTPHIDMEVLNASQQNPSLGSAFADAAGPDNGDIRINNIHNWSVDGTPASNEVDLQSIMLHELGHSLGLKHSAIGDTDLTAEAGDAALNTQFGVKRTLHVDDTVAVSALYDAWTPMGSTLANDIGVGGDGADADTAPDAWIVGNVLVTANDFQIKKWTGGTGSSATYSAHATGNRGAVRIAVGPTGRPWIIDGAGSVFERSGTSPTSGTWEARGPGCAKDIGVNGPGNGTAWILGCSFDGGYRVYRWTGSAWTQPNSSARGVRITVDGSGVPWLVASNGSLWRRPTAAGQWQQVPGAGVDIGAGPAATATVGSVTTPISYVYVTTSGSIWVWNEQPENLPFNGVPGRFTWLQSLGSGGATQIAVGPDGVPWIVDASRNIFRQ